MNFSDYLVFRRRSIVGSDDNGLPLTMKGEVPYFGVSRFETNGEVRWMADTGIPAGLEHLMPNNSTSVQLGLYNDPRDASYVTMVFHQNLIENFRDYCRGNLHRQWASYAGVRPPRWEFAALEWNEENRPSPRRRSVQRAPRVSRRVFTLLRQVGEEFIREAFKVGVYGSYTLMDLKKYGRDVVLNEMKVLSVEEFGLRYGLI